MTYWPKLGARRLLSLTIISEKSEKTGQVKSFEKINKNYCVHFSETVFNRLNQLLKEVFDFLKEEVPDFWDLNLSLLENKIEAITDAKLKEYFWVRFMSIVNLAKMRSVESNRYFESANV
jgi:hypothetical protein